MLRVVLINLSLIFLWTVPTEAQTAAPSNADWIRRADRLVQSFIQSKNVPGIAVAASVNNSVQWSRGFGYADKENRVPMVPNTRMRIASISKTLTATGALWLSDRNLLDWDVPIQRYLSNFPKKQFPITARQLAAHTAGIRGYRPNEYFSVKQYNNVLEALSIFKADSLLFKPDEQYHYTTFGYVLLSAVIQGASNQEFRSFMRQRVFEPLFMYDTLAEEQETFGNQYCRYYEKLRNGQIRRTRFVDNSNKWGGGGYLSTVNDLVRFGGGLMAGKILRPETFKSAMISHVLNNGKATGYGIGWARDRRGANIYIGHTGSAVGGSSILVLNPDQKIAIAMICNLQNTGLKDLAYQVMALMEQHYK